MNNFRFNLRSGFLGFAVLLVGLATVSGCNKNSGAPENIARLSMIADARSFDPPFCDDLYTHEAMGMVYEGLLEYEYLKRPHALRPLLAEALPVVSKDGLVYTFKIKKGAKFADSDAFPGGKGREVTTKDFIYSFLRVADPKLNAPGFWIFDQHIKGLNAWREKQKTTPATEYDAPPEGFKALDDHTLQITVTSKYPQLLFVLAMPMSYVVAREVVEKTGKEFGNNPVGTGPFKLVSWVRNQKIVFDRNPNWRGDTYPTEGEPEDTAKGFLADAGKPIPFVDKLELDVFVEEQPRWLNFMSGVTDQVMVPKDYASQAVTDNTNDLLPALAQKGVQLTKVPDPDVVYIAFNLEDPVIKKGGVNLRRAISLAIEHDRWINLFYGGRGVVAQTPIPPGVAGYDETFKNPWKKYDVALAKEYLKKAGFPDGKGLPELTFDTSQGTDQRQMAETLQKELAVIGIHLRVNVNQFAELMDKLNHKKSQLWGVAWMGDYPDVENFLQLLYGPNKAPSPNASNFDNPRYNKLFEQVRAMADSPERRKLIRQMMDIFADELPWIPVVHRVFLHLNQPWLKNYKPGYMGPNLPAKYYHIDLERKKQAGQT